MPLQETAWMFAAITQAASDRGVRGECGSTKGEYKWKCNTYKHRSNDADMLHSTATQLQAGHNSLEPTPVRWKCNTQKLQWCRCASLHCYTTTIKSQNKLKKYSKAPLQWCRYDITAITATKLTLLFQKNNSVSKHSWGNGRKIKFHVPLSPYYLKVSKNINN